MDPKGDLFIADDGDGLYGNGFVMEVPWTGSGFGAQTTVLASGLSSPEGVAMDGKGNLFINDMENQRIVELPWTGSGFGAQIMIPANGVGNSLANTVGMAVDKKGDLFVAVPGVSSTSDPIYNNSAVELPWTGNGYGTATVVPASGLSFPNDVAVDGSGDVFIADWLNNRVVEVPWTGNGYGAQTTVGSGLNYPTGVAVDAAGDLFIADYGNSRVVEVPWTGSGFGAQITLASGIPVSTSLTVDGKSDHLFMVDGASGSVLELQLTSANLNLGSANVCPAGQSAPAPCSQTATFNYTINDNVTIGAVNVST